VMALARSAPKSIFRRYKSVIKKFINELDKTDNSDNT